MNVEAITFQSSDPGPLAEFYCAAFELAAPRVIGADHLGLDLNGFYLGIDRVAVRPYGGGAMTLWVMVENTEATFQRLVDLGADPLVPPDSESSPGEILAQVADPEGNRIGLICLVTALEQGNPE